MWPYEVNLIRESFSSYICNSPALGLVGQPEEARPKLGHALLHMKEEKTSDWSLLPPLIMPDSENPEAIPTLARLEIQSI